VLCFALLCFALLCFASLWVKLTMMLDRVVIMILVILFFFDAPPMSRKNNVGVVHGFSSCSHPGRSRQWSMPLQVAASVENTDVVATENDIATTTTTIVPSIQRKHQTFLWKHNLQEYDINYRVEGNLDGPPVLLIHGFGANLNHYRYQFPPLVDEGFRVYAIDLIGFGASPKPADVEYSIELFVQLASDFIRTMQASAVVPEQQWVVAGNSIGGLVSLGVAEELKELVRGVILFNCAGGMTGFRYSDVPAYVRPLLWFFQKVLLGPQMGSSFFKRFKTRENVESILRSQGVYRNQTNVNEELLEILLEPSEDEGAETVFLKTFAGDPGPSPEEILPNLSCPVFAIWGDADPWTPVDRGMHPGCNFGSFCHDFELHVIPNCGHCPHDEAPEAVNDLIVPWLKGLDTRKSKTQ